MDALGHVHTHAQTRTQTCKVNIKSKGDLSTLGVPGESRFQVLETLLKKCVFTVVHVCSTSQMHETKTLKPKHNLHINSNEIPG